MTIGALALMGVTLMFLQGHPDAATIRTQGPDQLTVVNRFLGIGPRYDSEPDEKAQLRLQLERLQWETYHSRQSIPGMVVGHRHPHRPRT
ncbi:MAG: hypothetical protein HZC25_15200 [Rhodospirillales bacterium]|nr:hypothetical protein [Rhodospirillales bacterium]